MKKAFTLIELLVVIAIIAILAAILFPVFAQAKLAAKQSVNLSNHKELGLAVIMYTVDYDDYFPLAQRYEPTSAAFFGLVPWQVEVQPYIKNWGIFQHPLGPQIPSSPASVTAWRDTVMYGAMAKAENSGYPLYKADPTLGSFAFRVCGNRPCEYEGLFGTGCAPSGATQLCPFYGGASKTSVPSYSSTGISNPADALLVSEGSMWDLWSEVGVANPCTYGVYWTPAADAFLNITGAEQLSMACSAARHNPLPQTANAAGVVGACTPTNLCDGINDGIQNGQSTYVASDGHAVARSYRGGLMQNAVLADGTVVIKSMWPAGGF